MLFFFQHFLLGFFVETVASFDDTLTRIPVIASLTRTLKGKLAFSLGTFLALSVTLVVSVFFSSILDLIPYQRVVIAGLILLVAVAVYFEVFVSKSQEKVEKKLERVVFDRARFIRLTGVGFVVSLVTFIDDSIVLVPLFLGDNLSSIFAALGVYVATLVQIAIVIYFGDLVNRIKYKKEIASVSLVILAILVAGGII